MQSSIRAAFAKSSFALSILGSIGTLPLTTTAKAEDLKLEKQWSIPLREISALSNSESSLILASDSERHLLKMPLRDLPQRLAEDQRTKLSLRDQDGKKMSKDSQWEALAADGAQSIFALKESEDKIFQFDKDGKGQKTYTLSAFDGKKHRRKGYEGLLLLKKSHILVALSQAPMLVEFGPKGDTPLGINKETILPLRDAFSVPSTSELYPLAHWELTSPGICEFSDLARGASEKEAPFALLKNCPMIIAIPELAANKTSFTPEKTWLYPSEIVHAEGLLALPEGFLMAVDKKAEKDNLFWLQSKAKDIPKK